ncbi:NTP transferase domain-containing protein [Paenibacillus aestuarii]|uniref:NTP transferase domain-containing protein n=1 Tax=Paenibacillus aestuarii TaxID=516965 RepID=A0ABW0K0E0_9BACL|nr:NTP transferase domain-containing protein [Paenibacillus aestuarii]
MANSAVILAGGLSTRYGKNKILEEFKGKTLIDYSLEFCDENNINKKVVVYYDESIAYYLKEKYRDLIEKGQLVIVKRPNSPEGTGMSLRTGAEMANDRFIVLFGDNYYKGKINDISDQNIATYLNKNEDEKNLRFAAIVGNNIIEKPHNYKSGPFFTGYMILNKNDVLNQPVVLSKRGEVEITDIFNNCKNKKVIELDISWEEITYIEDYSKMESYILQNNKKQ